jgi:O-antigen ligase
LKEDKSQNFYGIFGRNTGFVTYFSLIILSLSAVIFSNINLLKKTQMAVILAGTISSMYGLLQIVGADPINWKNQYNPVISFLGNPNFHSSFMGIFASILFAYLMSKSTSKRIKIYLVLGVLLSLFNIYSSNSIQGYFVFIVGVTFVGYAWIVSHRKLKSIRIPYIILVTIIGFISIFGMLQKGPLSRILYKESISFRGDYWRAGLNITRENLWFGAGFDGYGDKFRKARDLASFTHGEKTSTSAHNVFIDLSSTGGLPLFLLYLGITFLVVIAIIRVLNRENNYNKYFVAAAAGWLAYTAQSIISINQIGLATIGWTLGGSLLGYEIQTREKEKKHKIQESRVLSIKSIVFAIIGFFIGIALTLPPLLSDAEYKRSIALKNPIRIEASAYKWPTNSTRMYSVAKELSVNNYPSEAYRVAKAMTKKYPENFGAWQALYNVVQSTSAEKTMALRKMRELDPLNPTLSQP